MAFSCAPRPLGLLSLVHVWSHPIFHFSLIAPIIDGFLLCTSSSWLTFAGTCMVSSNLPLLPHRPNHRWLSLVHLVLLAPLLHTISYRCRC